MPSPDTRLRFVAALLAALALPAATARADSSILIWPIDPVLEHDQRASALWLENRGAEPAQLQLRIFAWSQTGGEERFQAQREVVGSPPMLRIPAGARQLVRLTRLAPTAPGSERAYRVVIDEIPRPQAQQPAAGGNGIRFQLRYSVPLFLYGDGLGAKDAATARLDWRLVDEGDRTYLEVSNRGAVHVRLTRAAIEQGNSTLPVGDDLLGYVLAGSAMRWPLPRKPTGGGRLWAEINGVRGEIPAAAP
ncbi:molecular chaperone [Pseudomonas citronellolis]|uniref:fimbrial biogenesis chaperone n=1 Tax=Pseudomonas citronellolis TaxID=53408 RepID=UPI002649E539|nr:molecular chaperone [Pseudomonas citronellolis]MDN6873303.1 molecular chaperone [Pseudomonas citronellolis]